MAFALCWPQHFLVMFDLPQAPHGQEKHRAAGQNAFAVLQECIAAAQQSGDLPASDPLPLAWMAWWLLHGIAKLAISGNLPLNARSTIEFARSASRAIFGGMKAGPSGSLERRREPFAPNGDCRSACSLGSLLELDCEDSTFHCRFLLI